MKLSEMGGARADASPPHDAGPPWRALSNTVAIVCGVVVAVSGVVGLVAFAAHWTAVLQWRSSMPPVSATTACALTALGIGVVALNRGARRTTVVAVGVAAAIALASFAEYISGARLVSGRLGTGFLVYGTSQPGQMELNVAVAISVASAALLWSSRRRRPETAAPFLAGAGAMVTGIAVLSLFGYATGLHAVNSWGGLKPMSLQTAFVLVVLGIGVGAVAAFVGPPERLTLSLVLPPVIVVALSISLLGWNVVADLFAAFGHSRIEAQAISSLLTGVLTTALIAFFIAAALVANLRGRAAQAAAARLLVESEQRAEAERLQREAAGRLESLIRSAPDGIVLTGADGVVRLANAELERMLAYDRGELTGMPLEKLVPDTVAPQHAGLRSRYMQSPSTRQMGTGRDLRARRKDGSEFPVEVSLSPMTWQGEQLALAFVRDVTENHRLRKLEHRWSQVIEHAEWGVVIGSADRSTLQLVNPAFARMHGYEIDELIGAPLLSVFAPEEKVTVEAAIRIAHTRGHHTFESVHVRKDGTTFPVLIDVTAVRDESGSVAYRIANVQDISARRRAEAFVRAQRWVLEAIARGESLEESLASIVSLVEARLPDGRGLVRVRAQGVPHTAPLDVVVSASPGEVRWLAAACVGAAPSEPSGSPVSVLDLEQQAAAPMLRAAAAAAGVPALWCVRLGPSSRYDVTGALLITRPDARPPTDGERTVLEAASQLAGLAVERTLTDATLSHQALHDDLTGLPNRQLFFDRLAHATIARGGHRSTVLYIDLDRFKVINDSLGHDAGDRLLVEVAARLRDTIRPADTLARLGGDEFAVIVEDEDNVVDTAMLARRMLEAVRRPLKVAGRELRVTASIGAVVAGHGSNPIELVRHADAAMYRAKATGGGRLEIFDDQLRGQLMSRMEHEQALRAALDSDEFVPVYQPIRDVRTGMPVAFEALARWRRPDGALLAADEFVPMAEEAGLIADIDERILRRACADARRWATYDSGETPLVHVNLSVASLERPDLVRLVKDTLGLEQLPPARLCLEITETAAMRDVDANIETLGRLRDIGVAIALDDFGTGQASFNYLERLPVDEVKVDRAFVQGLRDRLARYRIVESIVSIADALGMEVTAEGIESNEQLADITELGVGRAQGFLLGRPSRTADLLRAQPVRLTTQREPPGGGVKDADSAWRPSSRPMS